MCVYIHTHTHTRTHANLQAVGDFNHDHHETHCHARDPPQHCRRSDDCVDRGVDASCCVSARVEDVLVAIVVMQRLLHGACVRVLCLCVRVCRVCDRVVSYCIFLSTAGTINVCCVSAHVEDAIVALVLQFRLHSVCACLCVCACV